MCRNSIISLVIIILIHEIRAYASPKNIAVCFESGSGSNSWCQYYLKLCDDASFAYNMSVDIYPFPNNGNKYNCSQCLVPTTNPQNNSYTELPIKCNGKSNCSLADISVPPTRHGGGILTLTFVCNNTVYDEVADNSTTTDAGNKTFPTSSSVTTTSILTEDSISSTANNTTTTGTAHFSTDSLTVAIAVSVVIPVIIAVVVVAFMMYRRGKCKLRFIKCMKMYDKHTDTADAYVMSSRANVNRTYDLSRDVDVNVCDVDYCQIDKVGKETDVEYSHVNLEKKQAVQDLTYNHIDHFNSSSGNYEQTYNHVGDVTLPKTESSSLQPDTYSHIGTMAKPASEQLTDDSYAHINGVMKYTPEANDINPYDCAILESNCGPTGGFAHRERKMNSGKEKKFYVVGPSKVDVYNGDPVSHSYFVLEKHEKEA